MSLEDSVKSLVTVVGVLEGAVYRLTQTVEERGRHEASFKDGIQNCASDLASAGEDLAKSAGRMADDLKSVVEACRSVGKLVDRVDQVADKMLEVAKLMNEAAKIQLELEQRSKPPAA